MYVIVYVELNVCLAICP